ncbi:MAG: hypothetical protein R3D98_12210 [Candidatus Krumholzibacteriia bacterium]
MASRGRVLVVLALALVAGLCPVGAARAATEELEGRWRLGSPLGEVAGPWLLVRDHAAAAWRLELAVAETGSGPTRDDLRARRGRGWTICAGPDGAFIQPWNERWSEVGPATARFLSALVAAVGHPESAATGRLVLPSWDDLPAAWQPPRRVPAEGGRLHRRLVERGLGRGGDGLVVSSRATADGLRWSTRRWPVVLLTRTLARALTPDLPPEAFLPLWPLAQFGS